MVLDTSSEVRASQLCAQSSPSKPDSYSLNRRKEKRQPSITPRKFTRFFTPRSHGSLTSRSSRRALFDITTPANNHNGAHSSPLRPTSSTSAGENSPTTFTREMKRRKLIHSSSSSVDKVECGKSSNNVLLQNFECENVRGDSRSHKIPYLSHGSEVSDGDSGVELLSRAKASLQRIKRLGGRGLAGELLELSLSYSSATRRQHLTYPAPDWHDETAGFYSRPEDTHFSTSIESSVRSIPFCVASCNTNSLVVVGDEEGQVRLLESSKSGKPAFKNVFLAFRPHTNAIIDMSFSLDDSLLATASGDQTARVVDMVTQTTVSILAQHSASLKQVRFQPGIANNSIIATSSRDGSVQIWDLRCTGAEGPAQRIHVPFDPTAMTRPSARTHYVSYGYAINSIYDAHRPAVQGRSTQSIFSRDGPARGEIPGRIGDVSITSISFLPHGQQHLLMTASEANATIKLWDIRSPHNTRRKTSQPVSCTAPPRSHSQWRNFGINSLSLGGDGSRVYALCRDNTVYAYSTAHLTLGQAPELSGVGSWRRRNGNDSGEGLGPLYGFRHKQLHATSFYVKSALRPAKNGKAELLAVGSCDGCAVLFPTDEKYLNVQQPFNEAGTAIGGQDPLQTTQRSASNSGSLFRMDDSLRISENGTPLVRGHDREVGALSWTSDGDLVTVGDDFLIRCWREGKNSRDLRVGGEHGGQRWGCGWADVPSTYDDEDG